MATPGPTPRTRIDRVHTSAGIVQLALRQIEDELRGEIGAQELAEVLRELHHEDPGPRRVGLMPATAARARAAALSQSEYSGVLSSRTPMCEPGGSSSSRSAAPAATSWCVSVRSPHHSPGRWSSHRAATSPATVPRRLDSMGAQGS